MITPIHLFNGTLLSCAVFDLISFSSVALQASNEAACQRACQVENEFLCRSYLFKETSAGLEYNCQLYHLDHFSLPDGPSTFLTTDRPLLDDGEPIGKFVENICISKLFESHKKT